MNRFRRLLIGAGFREFAAFFLGSGAGLLVDLAGFQLLVLAGLEPWLANATSSFISITVVYFLVSRYSFGARAGVWSYVAFVVWYSSSIAAFSFLIQLLSDTTGWPPIAWKLLSVPVSFVLNYLFGRFLFRRLTGKPDDGASEQEPALDAEPAP